MSLRMNTNVTSEFVQRNLRKATDEVSTEMEKLSSGKRINKAADDASGIARASKMEAEVKSSQQAKRNASDGISLVQTAEGGLSEVSTLLTRMRELSVQSASDILSEEDREYVDIEFQQMANEVERISQSTSFNGVSLINGDSGLGVMNFHVGHSSGDENVIEYDVDQINVSSSNLGIDGSSVSSRDDAVSSLEEIDEAIKAVNGQRAVLGSVQRRLSSSINHLDTSIINKEAAKSQILDADIADSASKLVAANIKQASGVSVLAQANMGPASLQRLIG